MLIYHHGAGETIDELVELQSRSTSLVGHLLEEGWAVAATAAGGDHWGSQAGIDANTALWEALDDDLRVDSVVLLGHSMGGVSSLSCIVQECVPGIDGWIGIYPLVDQRSLVGSSIAAEALPAIEQTFGGAPPPSLIPLEQADALAEVPMVAWASPDDEVVPMETNAAELARRVEAAGGQVTLHTASGPHGDPSHYDAEAILDFLRSLEP